MKRQQGAVLLTLVAILVLGGLAFSIDKLASSHIDTQRQSRTAQALTEAKEALLAWSISNGTLPGRLPCPENTSLIGTSTEGQAQSTCNGTLPQIGRLAWRTLGTGPIRDGYGEPLWYALSPGFRNTPINSATIGQLQLDGSPVELIAIVFSAGPAGPGQTRTAPSPITPPTVANYLDQSNADGDTSFVSRVTAGHFNDYLITLSKAEFVVQLGHRVAAETRGDTSNGLMSYYQSNGNALPYAADTPMGSQGINANGYVPYGDLFYPGSAWLNSNGWFTLVGYKRIASNKASLTIGGKSYDIAFP